LKLGYKRPEIAQKTNWFTINRVAGNFSWEFNFADFGFFRFCWKKNRKFGFQALNMGITFRGFHVQHLKVTKMDSIWLFSLNCLQPISLTEVQQCKKKNKFLLDFCWGGFSFHSI